MFVIVGRVVGIRTLERRTWRLVDDWEVADGSV